MVWSKLKTRVLSAAILVVILLVITFAPAQVFTVAVSVLSLVVLHELMATFGLGKKRSVVVCNYIFALAFMIPCFVKTDFSGEFLLITTIFFVMVLCSLSVFANNDVDFKDVCASLFIVIYSVVILTRLALMREMENGLALVFLAFIGAWLPDTVAYFAGNLFGKHKLIPEVSPNKTVEGSVGAFVGAIAFFLIYGAILSAMGFSVNFLRLLILSVICGAVSQIGDLSASVMKRTYNIKDFGNLIPGHGGLLDRIDSLMFVTPVVYYFVMFFPII